MNPVTANALDLAAGAVLLTAVLIVWRRDVTATIRLLAAQGAALALLVLVLAGAESSTELVAVAAAILAVKAGLLPWLIARSGAATASETDTGVNPTVSLLAAAVLIALAFVVARPVIALATSPQIQPIPVGFAVVFLGFLVLVTRRRAAAQVVGFVLIDNGIAVIAFLTTTGVPLVVELGAALTVLLAVAILQVLTTRMQHKFGDTDLDELQELHD